MRQTRRLLLAMWCAAGLAHAGSIDLPTLRAMRKVAARRPRRMIFNNDGDDVIYVAKKPTKAALLAARTAPLLGGHVDSIFYSNSLCFGDALHDSRVFRPFLKRGGICKHNILPGLLAQGLAPIQVMVEWGHAHGVEVFWDMRMNDTHDARIGGYGPVFRPQLKLDHPEWLCGSKQKFPPFGTWSAVDYARPEVRDLCYRFFEEVCRRFDVDGVEMDFFRHPCFFKSVAWGRRASRAELAMMTDLVRRIRAMTEREGMRRGRPILVAIRVPDSVEYCRGIGLDVERWLQEGLADILVTTGYFRLHSWKTSVELGHRYGVPVYPCLSDSRVRGGARFSRRSLESYRGRALRAWAAGADGIYIFNYFNPRGPIWRELGDPDALRRRDKLYFVTVRDGDPGRYLVNGSKFRAVPVLTPLCPLPVRPDRPAAVEMVVGDDLPAAVRSGLRPRVACHVRVAGRGELRAALNGHALSNPRSVGEWLDFSVRPEWVKPGANRLEFQCASVPRRPGEWGVVYEAKELPGRPWRRTGFRKHCVAELREGALFVADRGTTSGAYAFFQCPCAFAPEDEAAVEARLKTLSGWSSLVVSNGEVYEEIQFFTDRVRSRDTGLSFAMNTADGFHTYRLVLKGRDFRLYADGALALQGKARRPAPNGRRSVEFGAANSSQKGEALWKFVKIAGSPAAAVADLVLSIRFE